MCVPPLSGLSASETNASRRNADSAITRKSPAIARLAPKPTAGPFTAVTTGNGRVRRPRMWGRNGGGACRAVGAAGRGAFEAVAQVHPGAEGIASPVTTTQRTFGSALARSSASVIAEPQAADQALRRPAGSPQPAHPSRTSTSRP